VHLEGLHKDLVNDLRIYQTQGGTSQVQPVFTSITFSLTTAPLTDNCLSLSHLSIPLHLFKEWVIMTYTGNSILNGELLSFFYFSWWNDPSIHSHHSTIQPQLCLFPCPTYVVPTLSLKCDFPFMRVAQKVMPHIFYLIPEWRWQRENWEVATLMFIAHMCVSTWSSDR